MNNRQIAKDFANGETDGKGSNLFIEGDTIYSYGHHFPIAKRYKTLLGEEITLFNSNDYSSTTASHKSYVINALNGTILECPNCEIDKAKEYLDKKLNEAIEKEKRARTLKRVWLYQIEKYNNQLDELLKITAIKNIEIDSNIK